MADQLQLDESQLDDFKLILELKSESLRAVVDRLRQIDLAPVSPDKLFQAAVEVLGNREDVADSLVRQALTLCGWMRQAGVAVAEVPESLRDSLTAALQWGKQDLDKWGQIEPGLIEMLSLPILRLASSAIDLSFEYTNLWMEARILTDIRPVFTEDATEIEGAVVSHAFRLRYSSMEGPHELNIAMDEGDIIQLIEQCDRAIRKARTARALMSDRAHVPTAISGEVDDA